jgi:hypothetical protein
MFVGFVNTVTCYPGNASNNLVGSGFTTPFIGCTLDGITITYYSLNLTVITLR